MSISLNESSNSAREDFWRRFKQQCKGRGHSFKAGMSSHELNRGYVDIALTPIKKPRTFDQWSGKLQITVSAGGFPVMMSKVWRSGTGDHAFDEILDHALACAAYSKAKEDRIIANANGRQATQTDPRFKKLKEEAKDRGARVEVTDNGELHVVFSDIGLEQAAAILNAAPFAVRFQTAEDREQGSDFPDEES